jgi:hypothetical protein
VSSPSQWFFFFLVGFSGLFDLIETQIVFLCNCLNDYPVWLMGKGQKVEEVKGPISLFCPVIFVFSPFS